MLRKFTGWGIREIVIVVIDIAIILLALGLRLYAAYSLPIEDDEPTYLSAALKYSNYIREGKYTWLAWDTTNYEHPSFFKIIYGISLLKESPLEVLHPSDFQDPNPIQYSEAVQYGMTLRQVSVIFGTMSVLVAIIINPLFGLFLAINTLAVHYSSVIYLEALPLFTSLLTIFAYSKYYNQVIQPCSRSKTAFFWLALSAVCLGITAASKYVYCVAGLAILFHWLIAIIMKKIPTKQILFVLCWGIGAVLFFFICDPYLWPHPMERITKTIAFHLQYKDSTHVIAYHLPFWQPLVWLFNPFSHWKTYTSFANLIRIDPIIFFLALIGIPRTFKKYPIFFTWLIVGLTVLFVWNTKWPQYTMVIIVPYCLAASQGIFFLYDIVQKLLFNSGLFQRKNIS